MLYKFVLKHKTITVFKANIDIFPALFRDSHKSEWLFLFIYFCLIATKLYIQTHRFF